MSEETLENLLTETRTFQPSLEFAAESNAQPFIYAEANKDRLKFWERQAQELQWDAPWSEVLDWQPPFAQWFIGGKINASVNALDRHVAEGRGDRVAFYFEGEPGDTRTITYAQLLVDVKKAANALTELGVTAGDRVAIYMPMIPEAAIAMLACARIGAPHSVVFGGFSAEALLSRIQDADAKLVITADGGYRKGSAFALKPAVDEALLGKTNVKKVLVVKRTGQETAWENDRDIWWHEIVERQSVEHVAQSFDSEHPLFILYTSGTTAKPKGIFHTTGGYLTQVAFTHKMVFDIKPESDVYWCTADVGWITGHSYVVYGPLINGATQVMYEGTPDTPHKGRIFEIVAKYGVTILYTAPTLIRTWMKWGDEFPAAHDLSSLRLLGSVGEPINPEAWMWYHTIIGGERCPIVDTWWQTETGAIMISPLPGITASKPGSAMRPLPGISAKIVDDNAVPVANGHGGYLILTEPWPSMLRGIWGEPERYAESYWSKFDKLYFAGDGAKLDDDGAIWLLGRVDDVMNVSGHRISTTEVESALVSHEAVAEAAVVGASDAMTGQGIVAFVILRSGIAHAEGNELIQQLRNHVAKEIGAIAKPRQILIVAELPKTRSGKIMRRLLRDVAENRAVGDSTTLADPNIMKLISEGLHSATSED
ncbi:MAG: acetate--CoA ligase [Actinobacteria bacterium]|uniref:acetate--CoA ligase n=1 Tax=freshwater metagenome TaxID=449393 RepID=A0A6J7ILE1_9ZZZZ|nr:acetate--CoA ligase [Actinomycetota bacterium]MSW48017.1 acetate--CoA ligase [Actinomycetota bacterium]MSX24345.1 acetate--CoA ligase [Actinomycetota bacterium]MSY57519.1 acetate--CoA ligase [Actinomycetota bacterium]MTB00998.1 acetate--CoA ligase [Actinomycetota bacterium]